MGSVACLGHQRRKHQPGGGRDGPKEVAAALVGVKNGEPSSLALGNRSARCG
jgi:hypothetical protein